jgi:hypothetical protein
VINASRCRQTSCRKIGRKKKLLAAQLVKDVMAIVNCGEESALAAIEDVQAFLPFLSRADQARIVNLSSGYGELGGPSSDVPSCSKLLFGEVRRGSRLNKQHRSKAFDLSR